jgi:hypothetical protein
MGLSFTITAGSGQRSHYWVQVSWDSWAYFTVSDSRLQQPGGLGPPIFIPEEQGGPVIPPGTVFPFDRLPRLAGLRWRYSNPPRRGRARVVPIIFKITPLHGAHRKHSPYIIVEACLPRSCIATVAKCTTENTVFLLLCAYMLQALTSNGRSLQSHCLTTGLYATICPRCAIHGVCATCWIPVGIAVKF